MKLLHFITFFLFTLIITACQKEEVKQNQLPIVNTGSDTTIDLTNVKLDNFQLKGSATDLDGTITSYLWSQVSGPNTALINTPGSPTTMVSGVVAGKYIFQLMATDKKELQV